MGEQSRRWQQPPRRYGKITNDELEALDAAGERLELVCYIGCGFGAMLALVAAAITWADAIVAAIGNHL